MSNVKLQVFSPASSFANATEVNNNYNAINGSSQSINEQNVRNEGIDFRNLKENLVIADIGQLNNPYFLSLGNTSAVDARYQSFSLDTSVRERPINHDSSGNTSTAIGDGTKLRVNGAAGFEFNGNELLRVNWQVNVNSNGLHTPLDELVTRLIDTTTKDGGSGATYPYGSGIGEWCWLIYPKFNFTSNSLNDSDFEPLDSLAVTAEWLDPSTDTSGTGIASNFVRFSEKRWDHTICIPSVFATATNGPTAPIIMINSNNNQGDDSNALGGPQMFHGSFQFKVPNAISNVTLYGMQLYVSGYWRVHGETVSSVTYPGMFLESEECDPTRTNTDGDPIPLYGVNGTLNLERTQISYIIHRTQVT